MGALFGAAAAAAMAAVIFVAGFTPGAFRVTESGAAEYRIAIRVPPGIGGLEPKLALVYNSQAGNGPLGVGWNLEGLSAITRCPKTPAQDGGARGGIGYDGNDRYCLDGQRLVAITGAYGSEGTEYRTERESFTKVVSFGTAGNGPASFKAWTKSGLILEYGSSEDSRIEAQGRASVRLYALNKITDRLGNQLTVSYSEDPASGEYFPVRIDYAGNPGAASVRLVYVTRPDPIYANVAGSAIRLSVRLTDVRTYVGENLVTVYKLAYGAGAATGRSRLTSVTECSTTGAPCFAPVTFSWQEPTVGSQNWSWSGGHGNGSQGWRMADLFGDGRQVYYTINGDGWHHGTRVNADGSVQNWSWSGHGMGDQGWELADLFGDGRQVYYTHSSDGSHYATRFNPDGTSQSWTWTGGHGIGDQGWRLADLFGDGRQVYYTHSGNGNHHATRLNPDGTLQNWTWGGGHGVGDQNWALGDLFGDGRQIYYTHSGDGSHYATRLNEDGTLQNWSWGGGHGIGNAGWQLGDLFGDGRQVYWTHSTDGMHYATRLNPDGTLQSWSWSGGHGVANGIWQGCGGGIVGVVCQVALQAQNTATNWKLADLFGDGRQVYYTRGTDGWHHATRLNPDGTLQNWSWGGGHGAADGGWQDADVFGDGRRLYYTHSGAGGHHATRFTSLKPDLMVSATDSLGRTSTLVHKPLTDGTVYSKLAGSAYPVQENQAPLYVVSSMSTSNGVGGSLSSTYRYRGARLHLTGGGVLGFSEVRATSDQTGITSATSFRQDYPFQGFPVAERTTQASGAVLSEATNTWNDALFPNGTGKHHRSDPIQSVRAGNDLNGAALPTVTTSSKYDPHGNAISVTVSTGDGNSKATTNTYAPPDTANWILGRLTRSAVQSTVP